MTHKISEASLIHDWESGICLRSLRGIAEKHNISPTTAGKLLNLAGIDTSKKSGFKTETIKKINNINKIIEEYKTRMTVRQIFYQMATRQLIELSEKGYTSIQNTAGKGRKQGFISWDAIEDRTRIPTTKPMWEGLDDFKYMILNIYQRDIWLNQPEYFEVWLEKRALFGVFNPITQKYGITLQTITGYSSISAIYDGAKRFKEHNGTGTILYFGDHDATGIDIDRALQASLNDDHGMDVKVIRMGLLYDDIEKYDLLPNYEKETDTRLKGYREKGYTKQAELDALPPNALLERIENSILKYLDLPAYKNCKDIESRELDIIKTRLSYVQFGGAE